MAKEYDNNSFTKPFKDDEKVITLSSSPPPLETETKIVNLLARPAVFRNTKGEISKVLIPEGNAVVVWSNAKIPKISMKIAESINNIPIVTHRINDICIQRTNDTLVGIPEPQPNVYYIVNEFVARNVCRIGRVSEDLLYPIQSYVGGPQPNLNYSYICDEYLYILSLGMVYSYRLNCFS